MQESRPAMRLSKPSAKFPVKASLVVAISLAIAGIGYAALSWQTKS